MNEESAAHMADITHLQWDEDPHTYAAAAHEYAAHILAYGHEECRIAAGDQLTTLQHDILLYLLGRAHFAATAYAVKVFAPIQKLEAYPNVSQETSIPVPITMMRIEGATRPVSSEVASAYTEHILERRAKQIVHAFLEHFHPEHLEILTQEVTADGENQVILTTAAQSFVYLDCPELAGEVSMDDIMGLLGSEIVFNLDVLVSYLASFDTYTTVDEVLADPRFQFLIAYVESYSIEEMMHVIDTLSVILHALLEAFASEDPALVTNILQPLTDYPLSAA